VPRYLLGPKVDEDLRLSAAWIKADCPDAGRRFLEAAFESFELLARFPEASPRARLKLARLKDVRFWGLRPPFNRWIVFYQPVGDSVEIIRVLYGTQNWREGPARFF